MITHELMRELLKDDLRDIREIAEFVPNEIVYKALIIREFMQEHSIDDPRRGIREFHAFERRRLRKLGFILPKESHKGNGSRQAACRVAVRTLVQPASRHNLSSNHGR